MSGHSHSSHRTAFFGTPELAVTIFDELASAGFLPSLIVTTSDTRDKSGVMLPTPVKRWALSKGVEVLQPEQIDAAFLSEFEKRNIAIGIVVAYGKILPQKLLDMPSHGMWNVHYSLLPRWRGAAPVEAAILNGDTTTGIAIQKIVLELDAGPLVACEEVTIGEHETAPELRERLNGKAKKLLVEIIPKLLSRSISLQEQDHTQATRCKKIKREDGLIELSDDSATNYRKFRAYFGWPGIYFFTLRGERVKITNAILEDGVFRVKKVIPEGKKEMAYEEFLRGVKA